MDITETASGSTAEKSQRPKVRLHVLALWGACRPWVFRITLMMGGGMTLLVWLVKYHAERNLLSVFLSYLPVWVVALPLLFSLAAGCLFLCWRSLLVSLGLFVWIVVWLGGYRFLSGSSFLVPAAGALSVMTYNRGEGSGKMLGAFMEENNPDVAVFQDAARRFTQLTALPQFARHSHTFQHGEFVLLSRWPLVESEPLRLTWPERSTGGGLVGTRSVVDWNGTRVVVYNIHLPTPRDLLYWYGRRGTFLYGLLGLVPHTPLHARHQRYLDAWRARLSLVSQLASRVRGERDPVLLLGDLNLPPAGEGYHKLCGVLEDAHEAAGSGFGHTFPSNVTSMARLFAPWIRIDHVFASSHWKALSCGVFRGQDTQHLPVGAVFTLR